MADTTDNEAIRKLGQEVAELRAMLADRHGHDQAREKAFEALYEELNQYKEDFVFQAEKPLILDMLLFYDSMRWFQQSLVSPETTPDVLSDSFQYMLDEFIEILYRRDVVPFDAGDTFDRKLHKAVRVDDTEKPEEDWRITQVLKRGFNRRDKVLRPEEVAVMRYKKGGKTGATS